uniref:Nucleoprotein n=1 Tax=Neuropteran chu-related virus OKIAV150 TaxID=2792594 RepID=A0A7T0M438_9VIRU|nr:nucleoprotein [Neuropteran chu-related virus OKIAV150]
MAANQNNANNDVEEAPRAPVAHLFGPADNIRFYQKWIKIDPIFECLYIRSCRAYPFAGHWDFVQVPGLAMIALAGIGLSSNDRFQPTSDIVYAALIGEMIAPAVPAEKLTTPELAKGKIITGVKALLNSNKLGSVTGFTINEYTEDLVNVSPTTAGLLGIYNPNDIADMNTMTYETAIRILYKMYLKTTRFFVPDGLALITHGIVAICKRGNVTTGFIDKVTNGIQNELNVVLNLRPEAISIFWNNYGQYINDNNIQVILQHWERLLPHIAIRLIQTVQQASGGGLTVFNTVGKAIMTYQDFPWAQIEQLYPEEFARFIQAVGFVNGNQYFGFRRDLGPARSTLFKSLGYVAKELLVKIGGMNSLNSYLGWPRNVPEKGLVDQIIATYEANRLTARQQALEMNDNINRGRELATSISFVANMNLFN